MARKIKLHGQFSKPLAEVFEDFVISQTAQGLSEITIATYRHHLHSISNHLDIQKPLEALTRKDLEAMIVSMRVAGLAHNSISSYCRVLRTFLNWCKRAGLNIPELPNIKDKETVKESYTDEELLELLKRPKKNCSFCEFRNWVIVNFLMNSGCRSSSVRNIQNRDVDLNTRQVLLRHNKNGRIQAIPLCSLMVSILREYTAIRGGKPEDYLFCDQYGGMLSMNGLLLAIYYEDFEPIVDDYGRTKAFSKEGRIEHSFSWHKHESDNVFFYSYYLTLYENGSFYLLMSLDKNGVNESLSKIEGNYTLENNILTLTSEDVTYYLVCTNEGITQYVLKKQTSETVKRGDIVERPVEVPAE